MLTGHILEQNIGKSLAQVSKQLSSMSFDGSGSDIAILSVGKYIDEDTNLAGELQNTAEHPIKAAGIYIPFFEEEGGVLARTEPTYATMAIIMSNRTFGLSHALTDDLKDDDYSISSTSFAV